MFPFFLLLTHLFQCYFLRGAELASKQHALCAYDVTALCVLDRYLYDLPFRSAVTTVGYLIQDSTVPRSFVLDLR